MAKAVLIGNGINRISNREASWEHFLGALRGPRVSARKIEHLKHKPFALVYEEALLSLASDDLPADELLVKRQIADLANGLGANKFHERVVTSGIRHVLTTNYEYGFEKASGLAVKRANLARETKYSLFRRRAVGNAFVWHVHGEADTPNTITLGYDQYSGYLQKLRAYATAERSGEQGSPFKRGDSSFDETAGSVYSWLDVFLRDDVHIVGLGLDYTEIDLWWALTYKARLRARKWPVGKTVFYDWYSEAPDERSLAKRTLLQSLAVEVRTQDCSGGYEQAYDAFISTL